MAERPPVRRGILRRVAGETVPLLLGFAVAWVVSSVRGWPLGLALGVAAALVVSAFLRFVIRPRPVLRRAWRLAILAHLLFWAWQGVQAANVRPPGPVRLDETKPSAFERLHVGVGEATFSLGRAPLAGYGGRPRRKAFPAFGGFGALGEMSRRWMAGDVPMLASAEARNGARDGGALGARALVLLRPDRTALLTIVRLDLVVVDDALAERVGDALKDVGGEVLVAATHTHCGPGGFHTAPLAEIVGTDFHDARIAARVVDAAVQAARAAAAAARPARLAFAASTDRDGGGTPVLARNRRLADENAIDDRVLGMRFEDDADGHVLALLLNYAVHPTFYGADHLAFDRDLAGAVEDAVAARIPGRPPVLFVNGALGDVGPRRAERTAEALRSLAERFADRIAPDLAAGTARPFVRVVAARATRDLGSAYSFLTPGSRTAFDERVARRRFGEGDPAAVADFLCLPLNALPWAFTVSEARLGFTFDAPVGAALYLDRHVRTVDHAFGAVLLASADDASGTAAERRPILWVPGEPTQALGKRWRARAEALGLSSPFLFALTNGSIAYLTTPEEFDRSDSYEARATLFGAHTADRVEECLFAALDATLR